MRRSSQGKSSGSGSGAGAGHHKYDLYNARALLTCYTKTGPRRPSKWDDAQKWLSGAPGDDGHQRSSTADGRLPLPLPSQKGGSRHSWSGAVDVDVPAALLAAVPGGQDEGHTKRVVESERRRFASLTLRDVGTEMTPGGSKEPSRTNTPRAAALTTAAARGASAALPGERDGGPTKGADGAAVRASALQGRAAPAAEARTAVSPATAWNEAERAKHMARYRREDLKIQAWENRERREAELRMKMTEVKAERRKLRAREKAASKLATAEAVAREKRARAEAKLARRAARVRGEGAVLLGRRGRSLKLPLLCS